MNVLKDVQENLDLDNFNHQLIVEEKGNLEVEVSAILREHDISPNNVHFNTRANHRNLDIAIKIKDTAPKYSNGR